MQQVQQVLRVRRANRVRPVRKVLRVRQGRRDQLVRKARLVLKVRPARLVRWDRKGLPAKGYFPALCCCCRRCRPRLRATPTSADLI